MLTPADKAILRKEILRALCRQRANAPHDVGSIIGFLHGSGSVPFNFTTTDTAEELAFLLGMQFLSRIPDEVSFIDRFRLTDQGFEYAAKNGLANG